MKYLSELILLIILIITGIIAAVGTRTLTFIEGSLPGAGFFPLVLGITLTIFCLIELKNSLSKATSEDKELDKKQAKRVVLFFALMLVAVIIGSPLIGLLPSLGIFLLISLIVWNKLSVKSAVINTVAIVSIVFLVFTVWLNVLMPWGLIGR